MEWDMNMGVRMLSLSSTEYKNNAPFGFNYKERK